MDWPDGEGVIRPLHYAFYSDSKNHAPFPATRCPALAVHGVRDDVVPIESSRSWCAEDATRRRLIELDDDHELTADLPTLANTILDFVEDPHPSPSPSRL